MQDISVPSFAQSVHSGSSRCICGRPTFMSTSQRCTKHQVSSWGLCTCVAAAFECPVFYYSEELIQKFGVKGLLTIAQLLYAGRVFLYALPYPTTQPLLDTGGFFFSPNRFTLLSSLQCGRRPLSAVGLSLPPSTKASCRLWLEARTILSEMGLGAFWED